MAINIKYRMCSQRQDDRLSYWVPYRVSRLYSYSVSLVGLVTILCIGLTVGCYGNETTVFPEGLDPLEDNTAEAPSLGSETISIVSGRNRDFFWVHGVGYVGQDASTVWQAMTTPEVVASRRTDPNFDILPEVEPQYEVSFGLVYTVKNIITVKWQENWRFGVLEAEEEKPVFATGRYQKVWGTEAISLLEGSLLVTQIEPGITEIQLIEHLNAIQAGTGDLEQGMQDRFDSILAHSYGDPLPTY